LVVDEGPGLSGSSMAAVAEALRVAGIARIAFFPGHEHEPGSAASPAVLKEWQSTPRFFTPLERITWNGRSLRDLLLRAAGVNADERIEDLSAGQWRKFAYADESMWPAACASFEQTKFLIGSEPGRRVIWKFQGLGSFRDGLTRPNDCMDLLATASSKAMSPPVIGRCMGFVATPWIEGSRLTAEWRKRPEILPTLAKYLVAKISELREEEQQRGVERLGEMLYWNTKEVLGDDYAETAKRIFRSLPRLPSLPSYGDGRMAPWEWVCDSQSKLWKADAGGHDSDHTMPGRQSFLWDIAGTIVEWNLDSRQRETLLEHLTNLTIAQDVLRFYEAAYAAFRMGQAELCRLACAHNARERARLFNAAAVYRERLRALLENDASVKI
jgi:hypothetical protein